MKISELIILNTELWWEWTKIFHLIKDETLSWEERKKICIRCEEINTEINKIIEKIDNFWEAE